MCIIYFLCSFIMIVFAFQISPFMCDQNENMKQHCIKTLVLTFVFILHVEK